MEPPQPQQIGLSASQIAAQAAMQHQNHQRKRSQTLPVENVYGQRRPSRGPASPPLLSLTEASGERQNGFVPQGSQGTAYGGQIYRNGLLAGNVNPAATAANVVFARSPQTSPNLSTIEPLQYQQQQPHKESEKPLKPEKSKVKLFSRPGKLTGLSKEKEGKDKGQGSPSKLGFGSAQPKANMSTHSLVDINTSGASSMYSMANSSSATIRAIDTSTGPSLNEKEQGKEKKHHHFLSRQKQKLSGKDDHHLPLSSANSNSRPVDPHAPSSFYNFNLPPSPGPATTSFSKSMSGLDLRHGGRALREKKREEKSAANQIQDFSLRENEASGDWPGPSSLGSGIGATMYAGQSSTAYPSSIYGGDVQDSGRYGLQNMGPDDAWPLLKSKVFVVFQGEDLRLPIEDFNRLVSTHIQRCIVKRAPNIIIDDLRDLLKTGFLSIDATLRRTSDDRLIPHLVEMWVFVFTSVLPCLQAIFLPLDLEFEGHGPLMNQAAAREFWGALPISSLSNGSNNSCPVPANHLLSVRRLVLTTFRDVVVLPRFELLQTIFSRLSLESINFPPQASYSQSPIHPSHLSTSPDVRPSTAMSLDPAFSSYSSQSTTLLNGSGTGSDSIGARSRGISNVSFSSDQREAVYAQTRGLNTRAYTPNPLITSGGHVFDATLSQRDANAEDSNHVTETVGRMLQCMSVLAAVGIISGISGEIRNRGNTKTESNDSGGRARGYSTGIIEDEAAQEKIDRLCKALKLNWLGRGRTGRNRRGLVGERTKPTVAA